MYFNKGYLSGLQKRPEIDTRLLKKPAKRTKKKTGKGKKKAKGKYNFNQLKKQLGNDMIVKLLLKLLDKRTTGVGRPVKDKQVKPTTRMRRAPATRVIEQKTNYNRKPNETNREYQTRVFNKLLEENPQFIFLSELMRRNAPQGEREIKRAVAEVVEEREDKKIKQKDLEEQFIRELKQVRPGQQQTQFIQSFLTRNIDSLSESQVQQIRSIGVKPLSRKQVQSFKFKDISRFFPKTQQTDISGSETQSALSGTETELERRPSNPLDRGSSSELDRQARDILQQRRAKFSQETFFSDAESSSESEGLRDIRPPRTFTKRPVGRPRGTGPRQVASQGLGVLPEKTPVEGVTKKGKVTITKLGAEKPSEYELVSDLDTDTDADTDISERGRGFRQTRQRIEQGEDLGLGLMDRRQFETKKDTKQKLKSLQTQSGKTFKITKEALPAQPPQAENIVDERIVDVTEPPPPEQQQFTTAGELLQDAEPPQAETAPLGGITETLQETEDIEGPPSDFNLDEIFGDKPVTAGEQPPPAKPTNYSFFEDASESEVSDAGSIASAVSRSPSEQMEQFLGGIETDSEKEEFKDAPLLSRKVEKKLRGQKFQAELKELQEETKKKKEQEQLDLLLSQAQKDTISQALASSYEGGGATGEEPEKQVVAITRGEYMTYRLDNGKTTKSIVKKKKELEAKGYIVEEIPSNRFADERFITIQRLLKKYPAGTKFLNDNLQVENDFIPKLEEPEIGSKDLLPPPQKPPVAKPPEPEQPTEEQKFIVERQSGTDLAIKQTGEIADLIETIDRLEFVRDVLEETEQVSSSSITLPSIINMINEDRADRNLPSRQAGEDKVIMSSVINEYIKLLEIENELVLYREQDKKDSVYEEDIKDRIEKQKEVIKNVKGEIKEKVKKIEQQIKAGEKEFSKISEGSTYQSFREKQSVAKEIETQLAKDPDNEDLLQQLEDFAVRGLGTSSKTTREELQTSMLYMFNNLPIGEEMREKGITEKIFIEALEDNSVKNNGFKEYKSYRNSLARGKGKEKDFTWFKETLEKMNKNFPKKYLTAQQLDPDKPDETELIMLEDRAEKLREQYLKGIDSVKSKYTDEKILDIINRRVGIITKQGAFRKPLQSVSQRSKTDKQLQEEFLKKVFNKQTENDIRRREKQLEKEQEPAPEEVAKPSGPEIIPGQEGNIRIGDIINPERYKRFGFSPNYKNLGFKAYFYKNPDPDALTPEIYIAVDNDNKVIKTNKTTTMSFD